MRTSTSTVLMMYIIFHVKIIVTPPAAATHICTRCENFERVLMIIMPEAVRRHLVGRIIMRFDRKGFQMIASKFVHPTEEIAKAHYEDSANTPQYHNLIEYIQTGPVLVMIWKGCDVMCQTKQMIGKIPELEYKLFYQSIKKKDDPGTINSMFYKQYGLVYSTKSKDETEKKTKIWGIQPEDIVEWCPKNC